LLHDKTFSGIFRHDMTPCYTLKEVADKLRVSERTVRNLKSRGLIKPLPFTRRLIFTEAEIDRLLSTGVGPVTTAIPTARQGRRRVAR
jgi:hypothetical protein